MVVPSRPSFLERPYSVSDPSSCRSDDGYRRPCQRRQTRWTTDIHSVLGGVGVSSVLQGRLRLRTVVGPRKERFGVRTSPFLARSKSDPTSVAHPSREPGGRPGPTRPGGEKEEGLRDVSGVGTSCPTLPSRVTPPCTGSGHPPLPKPVRHLQHVQHHTPLFDHRPPCLPPADLPGGLVGTFSAPDQRSLEGGPSEVPREGRGVEGPRGHVQRRRSPTGTSTWTSARGAETPRPQWALGPISRGDEDSVPTRPRPRTRDVWGSEV